MKQSNKAQDKLGQQLQQLPQLEMPKDIFSEIQQGLHKRNFIRKHKYISSFSFIAVIALSLLLVRQNNSIDEKDLLIQELLKRTVQLEQLLSSEEPSYTVAGSVITERIVNIEAYLTQLDENIKQTRDKQKISQLMATKLDLLGDLVLLQRKINFKPDYQKIKPFII